MNVCDIGSPGHTISRLRFHASLSSSPARYTETRYNPSVHQTRPSHHSTKNRSCNWYSTTKWHRYIYHALQPPAVLQAVPLPRQPHINSHTASCKPKCHVGNRDWSRISDRPSCAFHFFTGSKKWSLVAYTLHKKVRMFSNIKVNN